MHGVASSLFHVNRFPHQGRIVTIDQLYFFSFDSSMGNVPYVGKTNIPYESVRAGLFKNTALM